MNVKRLKYEKLPADLKNIIKQVATRMVVLTKSIKNDKKSTVEIINKTELHKLA
jgi:hypothetical protein